MKSKHPTPSLERLDLEKADSIAFTIESLIENFARSQYKINCVVERYTDFLWYCNEKIFLGSGAMLFMVGLEKNDSDVLESVYGLKKGSYHIRVYFLETNDVARNSIPPISQRYEFAKTLETTLGLPTLYIGSHGLNRD